MGCGCGDGEPVRLQVRKATQPSALPALGTRLTWRDRLGGWRVRWGIRRMRYRVAPGLYRVGRPDSGSPVLVTANYKLSVDSLRRHLSGLDVWVLVLDTNGVNVWCAAGKGTFGTAELVRSVAASGLAGIVSHRRLVVPQLGAVGVAAHEVARATGFTVLYGPVLARDLPAYLAAGMKATPQMRRVPFGLSERLVLAPVELAGTVRPAIALLLAFAALDLFRHGHVSGRIATDLAPFLAAAVTGGLLVPLLLPWLPFRAFAPKGAVLGLLPALASALLLAHGPLEAIGTALLVLAITSFMAMTFTGATTFTNEAGARLEVRRALPFLVGGAAVGVALRLAALVQGGI